MKQFENIDIPKGRRPRALTIWKKRCAICLVVMGELDIAVEATQELKSALEVDVLVQTVKNTLLEGGLGLAQKILKCKECETKLRFAETRRYWTVSN